MIATTISGLISGKITSYPQNKTTYKFCFASDLMSDVLRIDSEKLILLTGLANMQSVRTAEMADINCIILARGKQASKEMLELANENYISIIESSYSLFHIAGILYKNGINPLF